ncbi:translation initiation factor 2 [Lysinibacillus xylanilyticus]|uniref:translation initiation factor 2 n=1 Tax=Lysinibacillus xylanilyticus TaxID=582475 RepID=UPI003D020430
MKINNSKSNSSQPNDSLEIYAAKLAYVGLAISTLGNGIQTIAAGLALEALRNSNTQNSQNDTEQSMQKDNMQKQIDYLIHELKQIKKIIK